MSYNRPFLGTDREELREMGKECLKALFLFLSFIILLIGLFSL